MSFPFIQQAGKYQSQNYKLYKTLPIGCNQMGNPSILTSQVCFLSALVF